MFYDNTIVDKPLMMLFAEMLNSISNIFYVWEKLSATRNQRDAVTTIAINYRERIQGNYVFFAPNIPKDKLTNAVSKYATTISQDERILALLDNTGFGGAKDGVLLTDKKIYAHDMMSPPKNLELGSLRSVLFVDDKSNMLFLNNAPFYSNNFVDKPLMRLFAEMLTEISKVFVIASPQL